MLSVTFSQPIVIDANALAALLSLAQTPATVEPYLNGHSTPDAAADVPAKRQRKAANPVAEAGPAGDKPKRTRATKAEMEARRAAAAGEAAPEQASATGPETGAAVTTEAEAAAEAPVADAPTKAKRAPRAKKEAAGDSAKPDAKPTPDAGGVDSADLLAQFAKLIDSDFTQAKAVLDEFGVNRFSDLKPDAYMAFAAKLVELGV
jgi:hypothetical protein